MDVLTSVHGGGGNGEDTPIQCECCHEQRQIDTTFGLTGRRITVFCHVCQGETIITREVCVECNASATEPHQETCSFGAPWGV